MVRKLLKQVPRLFCYKELFKTPYFCQIENYDYFALAEVFEQSKFIARFQALAKELDVVLPISFFEKSGNVFFNSLAMIDADGKVVGKYRKAHIPTGQCYEEKFYFSPGDDDFKVFSTKYGKIGIGICWDQWFPEVARVLTLEGAEIIFISNRNWDRTRLRKKIVKTIGKLLCEAMRPPILFRLLRVIESE